MSAPDFPAAMTEEAVAEWLVAASLPPGMEYADMARARLSAVLTARAVLALVREKVREAVMLTHRKWRDATDPTAWHPMVLPLVREVTTAVMGDHPSNASGGHDEGRPAREEAPRG